MSKLSVPSDNSKLSQALNEHDDRISNLEDQIALVSVALSELRKAVQPQTSKAKKEAN